MSHCLSLAASHFTRHFCLIAVLSLTALRGYSQDVRQPTVDSLLSSVSAISSDSQSMFAYTVQTSVANGVPFSTRVLFCGGADAYAVVLTAGKEDSPIAFLTSGHAVLFHPEYGTLSKFEGVHARHELSAGEKNFNLSYEVGTSVQPAFRLDLPSLLAGGHNHELKREESALKLTWDSLSGKSRCQATFRGSAGNAIQSIEIRDIDSGDLRVAVRDIDIGLQPFKRTVPKVDLAGLQVADFSQHEEQGQLVKGAIQRALVIQFALRTKTIREQEGLETVNWDQANANNQKFGPPLWEVFKEGIQGRKPLGNQE